MGRGFFRAGGGEVRKSRDNEERTLAGGGSGDLVFVPLVFVPFAVVVAVVGEELGDVLAAHGFEVELVDVAEGDIGEFGDGGLEGFAFEEGRDGASGVAEVGEELVEFLGRGAVGTEGAGEERLKVSGAGDVAIEHRDEDVDGAGEEAAHADGVGLEVRDGVQPVEEGREVGADEEPGAVREDGADDDACTAGEDETDASVVELGEVGLELGEVARVEAEHERAFVRGRFAGDEAAEAGDGTEVFGGEMGPGVGDEIGEREALVRDVKEGVAVGLEADAALGALLDDGAVEGAACREDGEGEDVGADGAEIGDEAGGHGGDIGRAGWGLDGGHGGGRLSPTPASQSLRHLPRRRRGRWGFHVGFRWWGEGWEGLPGELQCPKHGAQRMSGSMST